MIVEIKDNKLRTLGSMEIFENTADGVLVNRTKNIEVLDYDFNDNIFNTNEEKVSVLVTPESTAFRSYAHDTVPTALERELSAYKALLRSYDRGDYYNCSVLIMNYFGHIDYGYEFGYVKTHDEIVCILLQTLLSQLSEENNEQPFTDFCKRIIAKIKGNMEK